MDAPDETPERRALLDRFRLLGEVEATQTALFQHAAAEQYGLGITDMKALSSLLRDGPQTAGALMAQLSVTSGAVTGVIDRLRRRNLARREVDPADRRKVIVTVDIHGLESRENVYLPIGAAFEELYATYSTEQLRFLASYLESAIEITRRETAALRTRDADDRSARVNRGAPVPRAAGHSGSPGTSAGRT
jgi:DNA-binding MarR family transcriptional regulator